MKSIILFLFILLFSFASAQNKNKGFVEFLRIAPGLATDRFIGLNHNSKTVSVGYFFGTPKHPFGISLSYHNGQNKKPGAISNTDEYFINSIEYDLHFVPWTSNQTGKWNSQIQLGIGRSRIKAHQDRSVCLHPFASPAPPTIITTRQSEKSVVFPISYILNYHPNSATGLSFMFTVKIGTEEYRSIGFSLGVDLGNIRVKPPILEEDE